MNKLFLAIFILISCIYSQVYAQNPSTITTSVKTKTATAMPVVSEQTEELKRKADEAYDRSDFSKALAYLKQAYELSKDARYVANQGIVLTDMKQYKAAIEAFEFFIASNPILPKQLAARKKINELRPEVKIISEPQGAQIFITGQTKPLGETPVKVRLVAGEYQLTIRKDGYETLQTQLFVIPGTPTLAQYKLNINGASLTSEYSNRNRTTTQGGFSTGVKTLLLLSAIGFATSTTTWWLTRGALIERNESLQRNEWTSAQNDADFYGNITWGTLGVSSSTLIGAGVWWYINQKSATPNKKTNTRSNVYSFTF